MFLGFLFFVFLGGGNEIVKEKEDEGEGEGEGIRVWIKGDFYVKDLFSLCVKERFYE